MTQLVRFSYNEGGKSFDRYDVSTGRVYRITKAGRVIADTGGISVYQGIKLKRILNFDFTPVRPGWWVLLCFKEQQAIGERLFAKRVTKLQRTINRKYFNKRNSCLQIKGR